MIFRQARRRAPGRNPWLLYATWDFGYCILMAFFGLLYRYRRSGMHRIPREGPLIFVANHQSHFDPPMVGMVGVDRPHRSFARSTLLEFKPLAGLMWLFGAIPLRQGESDTAAFKLALKELEAGRSVLIFPEGTRTPDGTTRPFKRGTALLIKRSGATVQPVAVEGAHDVWKIGTTWPKLSGWIALMAGEPIGAAELMKLGPDDALEKLRRQIEEMRLQLRAELRQRTNGQYPPPGPGDQAYWETETTRTLIENSSGAASRAS